MKLETTFEDETDGEIVDVEVNFVYHKGEKGGLDEFGKPSQPAVSPDIEITSIVVLNPDRSDYDKDIQAHVSEKNIWKLESKCWEYINKRKDE